MSELKKSLDKKINISNLFIVIASRSYIDAIRSLDGNIMTQISIARELKKPFFMIIDNKLSKEEKQYISEYFSKDNIVKRMEVDIGDRKATRYVAREIKRLAWETTGDDDVRIVTHDLDDDLDDNIEGDNK